MPNEWLELNLPALAARPGKSRRKLAERKFSTNQNRKGPHQASLYGNVPLSMTEGGFVKNHATSEPSVWFAKGMNKKQRHMCSDLEILAGMLLVPTRLKNASLGVSKRYYMIELVIFTCQKSPWNMIFHNPCTRIWVNNKLISSSHELRINSVYLQQHKPPMLNLF